MEKRALDLFETLRERLGCEYISDLASTPYCACAKRLLATLPLEEYPCGMLMDMAEYLYGIRQNFADAEEAYAFFCNSAQWGNVPAVQPATISVESFR